MKKKVLAIMMACLLSVSLAACGGSDSSESDTSSTKTEDTKDTEEAEDTDEEASENPWYEYSDTLTVCYQGISEADEVAVFVSDEDINFAVLGVADPETNKSISFVGEVTEDENGLTITDETSETSLTFTVEDNGDDTFTLDMGDLGKLTIVACTQDEAFELLDTFDQYTEPLV